QGGQHHRGAQGQRDEDREAVDPEGAAERRERAPVVVGHPHPQPHRPTGGHQGDEDGDQGVEAGEEALDQRRDVKQHHGRGGQQQHGHHAPPIDPGGLDGLGRLGQQGAGHRPSSSWLSSAPSASAPPPLEPPSPWSSACSSASAATRARSAGPLPAGAGPSTSRKPSTFASTWASSRSTEGSMRSSTGLGYTPRNTMGTSSASTARPSRPSRSR